MREPRIVLNTRWAQTVDVNTPKPTQQFSSTNYAFFRAFRLEDILLYASLTGRCRRPFTRNVKTAFLNLLSSLLPSTSEYSFHPSKYFLTASDHHLSWEGLCCLPPPVPIDSRLRSPKLVRHQWLWDRGHVKQKLLACKHHRSSVTLYYYHQQPPPSQFSLSRLTNLILPLFTEDPEDCLHLHPSLRHHGTCALARCPVDLKRGHGLSNRFGVVCKT